MDADYARLEWVWEEEKSRLIGVSSGLASAAKHGSLPLIQEWADRWEEQYAKATAAFNAMQAYTTKKWATS